MRRRNSLPPVKKQVSTEIIVEDRRPRKPEIVPHPTIVPRLENDQEFTFVEPQEAKPEETPPPARKPTVERHSVAIETKKSWYVYILMTVILLFVFWTYMTPIRPSDHYLPELSSYSMQYACIAERNEPIRLLITGSNFTKITHELIKVFEILKTKCDSHPWETMYLDRSKASWRKTMVKQIRRQPWTMFVLDTTGLPFNHFEFLKDALDGGMISHGKYQVTPTHAMFVLLTVIGASDLNRAISGVSSDLERHMKIKDFVKIALQKNGWEDRFIHRISQMYWID